MTTSRAFSIAVAVAIAAVLIAILIADAGWSTFVLGLAVLVVALLQLGVAVLPADLSIQRQCELELDDLIFYVTEPQPNLRGAPVDYLFQLHVAVANVGARKAVLSRLDLTEFLTADGARVVLPQVPLPLQAHRYEARTLWDRSGYGTGSRLVGELTRPPFVLAPDDVTTLRFRFRRGIDWSDPAWDVDRLRGLHEALAVPIQAAKVVAVFRQGARVRTTKPVVVSLSVVQQELYASALQDLTNNFTVRPTDVNGATIHIE